MEIIEITYEYINKFITNDELFNRLKTFDKIADIYNLIYLINEESNSNLKYEKIKKILLEHFLTESKINSLSDENLFNLLTTYISVPYPLNINQNKLNKLIKFGIKNNKREGLWRLAHQYYSLNMNIDNITNYFIEKEDVFYISETIIIISNTIYTDFVLTQLKQTNIELYYKIYNILQEAGI